jgi:hypothetical protein
MFLNIIIFATALPKMGRLTVSPQLRKVVTQHNDLENSAEYMIKYRAFVATEQRSEIGEVQYAELRHESTFACISLNYGRVERVAI